jgi:ketosteroid isomerase-like protein
MKIKQFLLMTLAILTIHLSYGQTSNVNSASDTASINKLLRDYATSVNTMDTLLAAKIWAVNDSISFIHPRGHEKGWQQVRENFYIKTMQQFFSERQLNIHNVAIRAYKDFAFVEFYWTFNAKLRNGGAPMTTKGRESQVLRKDKDGWKILHVHYSGMPVTAAKQGF